MLHAVSRLLSGLMLALSVVIGNSSLLSAGEKFDSVIHGSNESEIAPHGTGNVYAPDVLLENGKYRMWYGGQGKDGHDRIHHAESTDGITWKKTGVVLEDPTANHVNDPSVVRLADRYFMYYTVASSGVTDRIEVAASDDGLDWKCVGTAIEAGGPGEWDRLLVGRPSVVVTDGIFKMWYDGRKDLPLNAPDKAAPKSATSRRFVGFAASNDGVHWTKATTSPVYGNDAGGVHVSWSGKEYVMVYESSQGTMIVRSKDGLSWGEANLLVSKSGMEFDRYGHVTPFLLHESGREACLFIGAAKAESWDHNSIFRFELLERSK